MRIAINGRFYGAPITGVQRFAREVVRRIAARANVIVMLPRGVNGPPFDGGVPVLTGSLAGHLFEQLEFPRLARRERCDVCLNLSGTVPGWGGPHVAVVHDVLPLTHPEWYSPPFSMWYRWAVGRNAPLAARLITVSRWSAGQIAARLGLDADRIVVAGQGLTPFDEPADEQTVARVRHRYDLPPRFVLAAGYGDPRKNVSFAIEIMQEWWRRDADAPALVILGQTLPRVHGRTVPPVSTERLRVLGRVDDEEMRALYTAACAFVFPSFAEGFGRAPLEAAACGTPSVVGPYGAASEILRDGAVILPLDVGAWIAQLRAITVDGKRRDALVARGRMVARTCSWDDAAERVLGTCMDVAGRAPAVLGV